ncbi:MAG: hypothetical protein ACK5Q5_19370 [Planctomycetaceae bacterium]
MLTNFQLRAGLTLALWGACCTSGVAQDALPRGFAKRLQAYANGEERNRQTDLKVMEVQFKPMRMVWANITDAQTGEKTRQEVWYLVYRAVLRPTPARIDETDTRPINVVDESPKPDAFMPQMVLTTYDDPAKPVPLAFHLDEVQPEVLEAIRVVEQRPASAFQNRGIENGLSVVQPFPAPTPEDAAPEEIDWIYGVATWTGIDPETDYFQVTMRGFSNGFELRPGPNGEMQPWRKVIVQKFARRGDRFDPNQKEFEFDGGPVWEYQPDATDWAKWKPSPAPAVGQGA